MATRNPREIDKLFNKSAIQISSNTLRCNQSVKYRVKLRDCSTESTYWLEIPVDQYQYSKEPNQARLGQPSLLGEEGIPRAIREATESKLYEIADYLKSPVEKKEGHSLNGTSQNKFDGSK